jgi:hypothetical protein
MFSVGGTPDRHAELAQTVAAEHEQILGAGWTMRCTPHVVFFLVSSDTKIVRVGECVPDRFGMKVERQF